MNIFDSLALWGRKYKRQVAPSSGSPRFTLADVMEMFDRTAIYELTPVAGRRALPTVRPESDRKLKVSLLDDGISAIHSGSEDWYEVSRTAPSGELSKVRIVAHSSSGETLGEIRMLAGRRTYDQYFAEDPLLAHLEERASRQ